MRETKMKKVLVVMLALAMVFAMNITTFAATTVPEMSEPTLGFGDLQADGTWTVTISVDGSVDAFDYGIAYDNTKVSVSSIKFNSDFTDFYSAGGVNAGSNDQGITGRADNKTYALVGGTIAREDGSSVTYKGEIATITFKVTDASAQFVLIKNSGKLAEKLKAEGKTLDSTEALAAGGTAFPIPVATATPAPTATPVPTDTTATPATEDVAPTNAPTSDAPATTAPGTTTIAPVASKAPTTPATTAATATNTTSTSAKTGDTANVVLPIIAICAAATAVVVASKKKVEE